jgi:hypothetical protein
VPWLVQQPTKEECMRARKLKPAQMNRLEAVWKYDPDATLAQVQEDPGAQKELLKVALHYENAFEYQNVLAPLVQIEADYDKARSLVISCRSGTARARRRCRPPCRHAARRCARRTCR